MRGKECREYMGHLCPGITPAYAGKRMVFAGRKSRTWDHPRVCGEKMGGDTSGVQIPGSPPRMRGKDAMESLKESGDGITPAYAGKSCR